MRFGTKTNICPGNGIIDQEKIDAMTRDIRSSTERFKKLPCDQKDAAISFLFPPKEDLEIGGH